MRSNEGEDKKTSGRWIIFTAVVTALATVIITHIGDYFFNQPRPSIEVSSVGFMGPLKSRGIQLEDDLLVRSRGSRWNDPLFQVEDFGHLAQVERQAAENGARLTRAVNLVEAWAKQVRSGRPGLPPKGKFIEAAQVKQHPLTDEPMILSAIGLAIINNEVDPPPRGMGEVRTGELLFPLYDDKVKGIIYVHIPHLILPLPFAYQALPDPFALRMRLFAESMARGARDNLLFYSDRFVGTGREEAGRLAIIQRRLQSILSRSACLSANVTIRNDGKTAVTLEPWFALRLLDPRFANINFVMTVSTLRERAAENQPAASSLGRMTAGRRVLVEPFLSESGSLAYTSVPPGEIRELTLVGTKPMGSVGPEIKQLYDQDRPPGEFEVVGMSTRGELIASTRERLSGDVSSARDKFMKALQEYQGGTSNPL